MDVTALLMAALEPVFPTPLSFPVTLLGGRVTVTAAMILCRSLATPHSMLRIFTHTTRLLRPARQFSSSPSACADPWPLPHTPEHLQSTKTPEDIPPPTPLPRPNETIETMRARLMYQSRKRGTLESDLLLSTFARDVLAGMGEEELREYDKVRPLG